MRPGALLAPPSTNDSSSRKPKQLLVDLSVIAFHDAGTGIQRVTRSIFSAFNRLAPLDFEIRPVAATKAIDYRYLPERFELGSSPPDLAKCERVRVAPGDIFLGLDLSSMVMPPHESQLAAWRKAGAQLHIMLFDLLPLLHGKWFRPAARRNFRRWIGVVERQADSVITQCSTVAEQFRSMNDRWWPPVSRRKITALTIPLSGDLSASKPSIGLPDDFAQIERWIDRRPTVLAVGTVEPRKGYDQVLAAFEQLWRADPNDAPQLLLVGRPGWKTRRLQEKLASMSSLQGSFLWVRDASDELLDLLYARAILLLFASRGEGFGLPIAEAIHRGLPVLFRDLPELQQFEGAGATSFVANSPEELATAVKSWLGSPPSSEGINPHADRTWDRVAIELANALGMRLAGLDQPAGGR